MNRVSDSNPESTFARLLLERFVALGVNHVVLAPGSRSQALALEAARLEREGRLHLHVRIDERSAAFVALGIGLATGVPAMVITTSGSAVANLFPATLEAHHAGVPLLLLTADRPETLRGIRSNQTTRQDLMFGDFVRAAYDVDSTGASRAGFDVVDAFQHAVGAGTSSDQGPGPVHVNVQFVKPLSGLADPPSLTEVAVSEPVAAQPMRLTVGARTLVVAGARAGEAAERCARELMAPLIAEIVSGAHFGPQLVVPYRELLRIPEFFSTVQRVVVFGTPTLSREVVDLLSRPDVDVVVVDSPGADRFSPEGRTVRAVPAVEVHGEPDPELLSWSDVWIRASRKIRAEAEQHDEVAAFQRSGVASGGHVEDFAAQRDYVTNELKAIRAPLSRERLLASVWNATWPHDPIVFAASRLVRVADETLPGKKVSVFSNRGQAGIDGTIATAVGIALASESGTTRVVIGDLAALHDVGSMQLTPGEAPPRLHVIVGNDRGGTIFSGLPVAESAVPADFERVMQTPHDVSFEALSQAYGWEYIQAHTVGALEQALTSSYERPVLIEVPLSDD